jgi:hypothetical protein
MPFACSISARRPKAPCRFLILGEALASFWAVQGLIDVLRRKSGWGAQQRLGLERGAEVPLPPGSTPA